MTRQGGRLDLHPGINDAGAGAGGGFEGGFVGAQEVDVAGEIGRVEMRLDRELPGADAGTTAYGAMIKETYFVEGADVLARYADGRAAITEASFGEGKAILIGSYLGLAYTRQRDPSTGRVIAALVEHAADLTRPIVAGRGRVRVDTVSRAGTGAAHSDADLMIIVKNLEAEGSEVSVHLAHPLAPAANDRLTELFGGEDLKVSRGEDGISFSIPLRPREVRVYRG